MNEFQEGVVVWWSHEKHMGVIYVEANPPQRYFVAERSVVAGPRPKIDARVRFRVSPMPPKEEGQLWSAVAVEVLDDPIGRENSMSVVSR